jgi:hypothetical protein
VIRSIPGHGFSGRPATTGWDRPHRACLSSAGEAPRLRTVRRVGRRLGRVVVDYLTGGRDARSAPEPAPAAAGDPHRSGRRVFLPRSTRRSRPPGRSRPICQPPIAALSSNWGPPTTARRTPPSSGRVPRRSTGSMIPHRPGRLRFPPRLDDLRQADRSCLRGRRRGGLTRDDILENVTLFWLTMTGVSSSKLYWEYSFADVRTVSVPVAVSVFPDEIFQAPRSGAERAYPNLIRYNQAGSGRPLRGMGTARPLLDQPASDARHLVPELALSSTTPVTESGSARRQSHLEWRTQP